MRTTEELLSQRGLCERLQISIASLQRMLPRLVADGLQVVRMPGRGAEHILRYRASSLDRAIEQAARRGDVLGGGRTVMVDGSSLPPVKPSELDPRKLPQSHLNRI